MICVECRKELPESDFPNNLGMYLKESKTYTKHTTCKKCKYSSSKYRWNKQRNETYRNAYIEPPSRDRYTCKNLLNDRAIVGWNGSDEIYY